MNLAFFIVISISILLAIYFSYGRIKTRKYLPKETASSRVAPNIVVADFGEFWATRAPTPGCVADVNELPYPKNEIKLAILIMLKVTNDSRLREHLKCAYFSLANWQAGVGPRHKGLDITKIDFSKSVLDQAKEIAVRGEEMLEWQPIIKAEDDILIGELRQLGYWTEQDDLAVAQQLLLMNK